MSKTMFEFNSDGIREVLRSKEMLDICAEAAEGIKDRYGDEATVTTHTGLNRVNASVIAPLHKATKDNSLLKAVRKND